MERTAAAAAQLYSDQSRETATWLKREWEEEEEVNSLRPVVVVTDLTFQLAFLFAFAFTRLQTSSFDPVMASGNSQCADVGEMDSLLLVIEHKQKEGGGSLLN